MICFQKMKSSMQSCGFSARSTVPVKKRHLVLSKKNVKIYHFLQFVNWISHIPLAPTLTIRRVTKKPVALSERSRKLKYRIVKVAFYNLQYSSQRFPLVIGLSFCSDTR